MKFGDNWEFEELMESLLKMPDFRRSIEGPLPYQVDYPYGLPGDGFRSHARDYNATCVAYHRGVDPRKIAPAVVNGNEYRYGPGDQQYEEIKSSMEANGFLGGDAQQIILYVDDSNVKIGEGNHRLRIALDVGLEAVDLQIRYLKNADEKFHFIPFDHTSGLFKVISE
jgi:hypothetical protein